MIWIFALSWVLLRAEKIHYEVQSVDFITDLQPVIVFICQSEKKHDMNFLLPCWLSQACAYGWINIKAVWCQRGERMLHGHGNNIICQGKGYNLGVKLFSLCQCAKSYAKNKTFFIHCRSAFSIIFTDAQIFFDFRCAIFFEIYSINLCFLSCISHNLPLC